MSGPIDWPPAPVMLVEERRASRSAAQPELGSPEDVAAWAAARERDRLLKACRCETHDYCDEVCGCRGVVALVPSIEATP